MAIPKYICVYEFVLFNRLENDARSKQKRALARFVVVCKIVMAVVGSTQSGFSTDFHC